MNESEQLGEALSKQLKLELKFESPKKCHFSFDGIAVLKDHPTSKRRRLARGICLSTARANMKFLNNKEDGFPICAQETHHFHLISANAIAWIASITITNNAVHVQSVILSKFEIPRKAGQEALLPERFQVDHLTGMWDSNGLGKLHLTGVRDYNGKFDAKRKCPKITEYENTEEKNEEGLENRRGENCPQKFCFFTLTEEILVEFENLNQNLRIGSCAEEIRSTLSFSFNLEKEALTGKDAKSEGFNENVKNHHHFIQMMGKVMNDEAVELAFYVGKRGDCLDCQGLDGSECDCEELSFVIDKEGEALRNIHLTHSECARIPEDKYLSIDVKKRKIKLNAGIVDGSNILSATNLKGKPVFLFSLDRDGQDDG